jgi:hypothetical protein
MDFSHMALQLAHAAGDFFIALWTSPFHSDNSHAKFHAAIAYTGY